ncbi:MAG: NUDIX hydrolase [Sulfolobaceae archaeon]
MKIFESKKFSVHLEKFLLPNGKEYETAYIRHRGSVIIIPFLDNETVLMIRQYRPIVNKWLLEFPAGTIEENEKVEETAKRELIEETGYLAEDIKIIHSYFVSPGTSTEKMYIAIANELKFIGSKPESYELIELMPIKIAKIKELVKRKEIEDGKTLVAILFLLNNLL